MRGWLISFVLAALAASPGRCQVNSITPTLPETTSKFFCSLDRFIRSKGAKDLAPFTRQERLNYHLRRTEGASAIFRAATVAGFQQWSKTPREWKQGLGGYRKRFADVYASRVVSASIEYGASALLHEDNRYRRSLETGWWKRSRHAIMGAFRSTDAAGHQRFSYSRVGAAAATPFIRRMWQPGSTAGVGNATQGVAVALTAQLGGNLFREFWPDLRARFLKSR